MEAEYIVSLDAFKEYCKKNEDKLNRVNGNCKQCPQSRICNFDNKEVQVDGLLNLEPTESRFPQLLYFFQKLPDVPYAIPAIIYKSVYGLYHQGFSCPFNSDIILGNQTNIEYVYQLLTDDVSKMVFLNLLMYRLTLNREYIYRAYSMEPQYFISSFRGLKSNEVYVDCGAYNGDTFISYCQYNSVPRTAYLFEPDRRNKDSLINSLTKYSDFCKISVIEKAAYKFSGNLYFAGGKGVRSHLTELPTENSIPIAVTSIDDAVNETVSFIKMDIEGSEKEALLGAKNHILCSYPKLAICIYHNWDLFEIPLMIAELFPYYKEYKIRHHTKSNSETVLYVY